MCVLVLKGVADIYKVAPPFKTTEFDIKYGEGISYEGDLLDLAVQADIVKKTGAWFSYNNDKIGQGRENSKRFLQENEKIRLEIEKAVKAFLGLEE